MKALLLGTGGYHPSETRHTACVMLPEVGVVLDAGTGFFRVREHLATDELNVFVSHAHLDHVVGLTYLIDTAYNTRLKRTIVHAAPDHTGAIQNHLLARPLFPGPLPCEFRPLAATTPLPQNGELTAFPVAHPGGAYGFRLDWPSKPPSSEPPGLSSEPPGLSRRSRSLAYVTDTTADPAADYIRHIKNADILIHECYFPDGWENLAQKTGHSCLTPVLEVAKTANVGLLVLVHSNPLADEETTNSLLTTAQKTFPATLLATDHTEIEF
jgi:ribonuclease BN (tRNA processing enzyme)